MQRFLSELQRRKVLRIASGYVVAAWIILQVALSLQTAMNLPAWFSTVIVSLLIIGFPIALVLSWFFEITPEGIKRTVASGDGAFIKPQTTDIALAAALVLVLIVAVVQLVMPHDSAPIATTATAETPKPTAEPSSTDKSAAIEIPEASVAVLPFENLSADKDNAFFAAGIQDEILTRLTKIGSLKVISRTSTAHLASRPDNLPEIAKQLGVANILEGSVQRQGNAVRVNVQLIKASTDSHLWAEVYDRKLDNIFSVQSEIAISIAEALSAKVTGKEKRELAATPTKNTAAYDAYLRALAFMDKGEYLNAERLLQQAVKLDPAFAGAWALLARVHARLFHGSDRTTARRESARHALDSALRLQPEGTDVSLAQAYHQYWVERDFAGARRRFEHVHTEWPNNAVVVAALGYIARRQGRWDQALSYMKQAIELDPLSTTARFDLPQTLYHMRDYAEAQRNADAALNIEPDSGDLIGLKALILQALGQLDRADEVLKGVRPKLEQDEAIDAIFFQALYTRDTAEAISTFQGLLAMDKAAGSPGVKSALLNLYLGYLKRISGDASGATAHCDLVRDELAPELKRQPGNGWVLSNLALMYSSCGEHEQAMRIAGQLVELIPVSQDAFDGARWEATRARVWARFGDRDRAIPAIARLLKLPGGLFTPAILRLDPDFDKLRGDPRFKALLVDEVEPK